MGFSHFLTCKVITEDHKILFRFNSISDINLFLYNKCYDPRKRTLGLLRENQEQLRVLPDNDGRFSLVSSDGFLPSFPREKKPEWKDLEKICCVLKLKMSQTAQFLGSEL